jgi:hypothetical protein
VERALRELVHGGMIVMILFPCPHSGVGSRFLANQVVQYVFFSMYVQQDRNGTTAS